MIRLVVGLGNPGPSYAGTRHNLGASAVSAWLAAHAARPSRGRNGTRAQVPLPEGTVHALIPGTYMNGSGEAVAAVRRRLSLSPEEILVVSDDMDLPLGRLRVRMGGSSAGHRGVQSVIDRLGSSAFSRLRLGVGRPAGEGAEAEVLDHVLSRFSDAEAPVAQAVIRLSVEAIDACVSDGPDVARGRVNGVRAVADP